MRLYTEKQVRQIIERAELNLHLTYGDVLDGIFPIELPTDEEIEKEAPYSTLGCGYEFGMNDGFKKGAKFVIDKIQGGNK
jgi:hypothetical protein